MQEDKIHMADAESLGQWNPEDLQRIQNFRLIDDDFLTRCFDRDTGCIELVVQTVLDRPDLTVIDVRTQVFAENLVNRSVRFDVVATDHDKRIYNIEIQRADKGAGYKRARYNCSMLDANLLKKGEDFSALPETYVIFITENDVIGEGKPVYEIRRCFVDTGKVFEDGSHVVYVNGSYRGDTPIGKLMHDFFCTNPNDMYNHKLAERAKFFKQSKEGVAIMCRAIEEMRNQSFKEGEAKTKKANAIALLKDGTLSIDRISTIIGIPLEEVKKLSAELQS